MTGMRKEKQYEEDSTAAGATTAIAVMVNERVAAEEEEQMKKHQGDEGIAANTAALLVGGGTEEDKRESFIEALGIVFQSNTVKLVRIARPSPGNTSSELTDCCQPISLVSVLRDADTGLRICVDTTQSSGGVCCTQSRLCRTLWILTTQHVVIYDL